jgi:hypothetical protein
MSVIDKARQWGLLANDHDPPPKPSRWPWLFLFAAFLVDAAAVAGCILWDS